MEQVFLRKGYIMTNICIKIIELEAHAENERLTEPFDGRCFDYKRMLAAVKSLGRPLTEKEAEKYLIIK